MLFIVLAHLFFTFFQLAVPGGCVLPFPAVVEYGR